MKVLLVFALALIGLAVAVEHLARTLSNQPPESPDDGADDFWLSGLIEPAT